MRFSHRSRHEVTRRLGSRARSPTRRIILHVLRHEATATVLRARDGSVSIETALTLLPKPFNDFARLLDVMLPETAHDNPMFITFVDRFVDYSSVRITVIQGHNIPFDHPEGWEVDSSSCPKSLIHGTKECSVVGVTADGLILGGLNPGSRGGNYFSAYGPRRHSHDRPEEGPLSIEEWGVRHDSDIIIVYDGRHLAQFSRMCVRRSLPTS